MAVLALILLAAEAHACSCAEPVDVFFPEDGATISTTPVLRVFAGLAALPEVLSAGRGSRPPVALFDARGEPVPAAVMQIGTGWEIAPLEPLEPGAELHLVSWAVDVGQGPSAVTYRVGTREGPGPRRPRITRLERRDLASMCSQDAWLNIVFASAPKDVAWLVWVDRDGPPRESGLATNGVLTIGTMFCTGGSIELVDRDGRGARRLIIRAVDAAGRKTLPVRVRVPGPGE